MQRLGPLPSLGQHQHGAQQRLRFHDRCYCCLCLQGCCLRCFHRLRQLVEEAQAFVSVAVCATPRRRVCNAARSCVIAQLGSTNVHSGYGAGHRLAYLPHSPDSSVGSSSTPGSRQARRTASRCCGCCSLVYTPLVGNVVPRLNYYVYVKRRLYSRPE